MQIWRAEAGLLHIFDAGGLGGLHRSHHYPTVLALETPLSQYLSPAILINIQEHNITPCMNTCLMVSQMKSGEYVQPKFSPF